eukprot:3336542-Rhodomonas_salina.1
MIVVLILTLVYGGARHYSYCTTARPSTYGRSRSVDYQPTSMALPMLVQTRWNGAIAVSLRIAIAKLILA